jgi:polyisoprenoid-binding protein YceI
MKNNIAQSVLFLAITSLGLNAVHAESFDFKDPKGINNVTFSLDAPLESTSGTANGISGTVKFDPAHPENTSGAITLETNTLMVANSMMRGHLLGENWMNVEKYPVITFETTGVATEQSNGNSYQLSVTGKLTVKGITKEVTVPVALTYLPGKLADRTNGDLQGDLLVLRTTFTISRSDYGINAGQYEDKVSDEIALKLSIAGAAVK